MKDVYILAINLVCMINIHFKIGVTVSSEKLRLSQFYLRFCFKSVHNLTVSF